MNAEKEVALRIGRILANKSLRWAIVDESCFSPRACLVSGGYMELVLFVDAAPRGYIAKYIDSFTDSTGTVEFDKYGPFEFMSDLEIKRLTNQFVPDFTYWPITLMDYWRHVAFMLNLWGVKK